MMRWRRSVCIFGISEPHLLYLPSGTFQLLPSVFNIYTRMFSIFEFSGINAKRRKKQSINYEKNVEDFKNVLKTFFGFLRLSIEVFATICYSQEQ